jgi:hypothetical protein
MGCEGDYPVERKWPALQSLKIARNKSDRRSPFDDREVLTGQKQYFVPEDGIDEEVIDAILYWGNDARVRPHVQIVGLCNSYNQLNRAMRTDHLAEPANWTN